MQIRCIFTKSCFQELQWGGSLQENKIISDPIFLEDVTIAYQRNTEDFWRFEKQVMLFDM